MEGDRNPKWNSLLLVLFLLSGVAHGVNFCPEKCNCDDDKLIVTCIRADLEYMPNTLNPGLKTIVYKYNKFPTVDVSLNFLSQLVKIDMSHNHIVSVTKRAFSSQKDLKDLNLESNKVTQISNMTFYGLSNLQVLNFRSNNIEVLEENLFMYAKKLQKINFARNRIQIISNSTFLDLPDLRILNLENNLLQSIPTEAFKPLTDLAELYLSGNPLVSIPDGSFETFRSLTALDLSSCRLASLNRGSFRGLGTLRKLKLSDNELKEIPDNSLRDFVPNLEELYVGQNPFVSITSSSGLTGIMRLKVLDISGCGKLRFIGSNALKGSSGHLEHVVISENRHLKVISETAFGDNSPALINLRHLDLAENGLETLSEALLPNWMKFKVLDLTGNPWRCDCDTVFVHRVVTHLLQQRAHQSENIPDVVASTKCGSPRRHYGKPVYLIQPRDLSDDGDCYAIPTSSDYRNEKTYFDLGEGNTFEDGGGGGGGPPEETLIVIISVASVISVLILSILCFVFYKCGKRKSSSSFSDWFFKEYRWKASPQEPHREYAKTPYDDDFFFHQNAQNYQYSTGRSIPVTEL